MTTTIEKKSVAKTAIELFTQRMKQEEANVKWVEENQAWIDEVGLEVHASGNAILFYSPTHEQVIRIIREIGGKWSKRYNASTIAYSYHLPDYSRSFILCDSQPPGTCRMVPVVEIVPARWEPEKVINTFKLQCRDEDAPTTADVELPQENSGVSPAESMTQADTRRESATV